MSFHPWGPGMDSISSLFGPFSEVAVGDMVLSMSARDMQRLRWPHARRPLHLGLKVFIPQRALLIKMFTAMKFCEETWKARENNLSPFHKL